MATKLQQFFRRNPVFTYDAFAQAMSLSDKEPRSPNTIRALLNHHIEQGHVIRVRRKLFVTVPIGADSKTYVVNPYLIAGFAVDDAVIAYHTALAFHNIAYSMSYRFLYLTHHRSKTFQFRSETYEGVTFPKTLLKDGKQNILVNTEDIQGMDVQVTSLERTLVDVLDRPALGGGWEEIWRSLDMIDRLKVDQVINYALQLDNATTIAKLGFYLSQRKDELQVSAKDLEQLHIHCPSSPHYIDEAARKEGRLVADWNIIVSEDLFNQTWRE